MALTRWPDLHRALVSAGWVHDLTGRCHNRYRPPPGVDLPPIVMPGTPGRGRGYQNARARVKRALEATEAANERK